jgi:hypothetical protein
MRRESRLAAVYTALARARAPQDARAIAATFRQGARVERAIDRILKAWARVGQFHTSDGRPLASAAALESAKGSSL